MKLELKHLAPYLTHKLKAKNCFNEIVEAKGIQFGNESCNNTLWTFVKNGDYLQGYLYQCKPILRPLSDLNQDGEIDTPEYLQGCCYSYVQNLISQHYDVFGLIEKGLAIDVNTLNK